MEGAVIYPLIGIAAGLVGGVLWRNVFAGGVLALVFSAIWALLAGGHAGWFGIALGVILAVLMSFFGSVGGVMLREKWKGQ